MGDYVCKFNAFELHSSGEPNKAFKIVRVGHSYRLINDDGQVIVGSNGGEYDFVTADRAERFLINNLMRIQNTVNISADHVHKLIKNYAKNKFPWVHAEIESIKRFNDGLWRPDVNIEDGGGGNSLPDYAWTRPVEWLPMPTIADGEEKINLLVRIAEHRTEFNIISIFGDVTIDWGDGNIESIAGSNNVQHVYDFDNPEIHDSTATIGYKQAIVTITPQSGHSITTFYVGHYASPVYASGQGLSMSPVLECDINAPSLTSFQVGGDRRKSELLESVRIKENNISNWQKTFMNCRSLKHVEVDFTAATNLSTAFFGCVELEQIESIVAPNCTNAPNMFKDCYKLKVIKTLELPLVTNYEGSFNSCLELTSVNSQLSEIVLNLSVTPSTLKDCFINIKSAKKLVINNPVSSRAVDMWNTFAGSAFHEIDIKNTIIPNQMSYTFRYVKSILDWGSINIDGTAYCDKQYTFEGSSVKKIPSWFNLSAYRLTGLFQNSTLQRCPDISWTSDTKVDRLLNGCTMLTTVGAITNTASFHTSQYLLNTNMNQLESIGAIDCSKIDAINLANAFTLTNVDIFNINKTINFTNCNLSASEINKIFNNLLVAEGRTITITGCPGANECNVSIATAKGWTVAV